MQALPLAIGDGIQAAGIFEITVRARKLPLRTFVAPAAVNRDD